MDNNFKNLEEKANKCALLAKKILIAEAVMVTLGIVLPVMFLSTEWKKIYIGIMVVSVILCHALSIYYTILGYRMVQTKIVKEMFFLQMIVTITVAVGVVFFIGVAYAFWALFLGFAPEKISFWEMLTGF